MVSLLQKISVVYVVRDEVESQHRSILSSFPYDYYILYSTLDRITLFLPLMNSLQLFQNLYNLMMAHPQRLSIILTSSDILQCRATSPEILL